MSAPAELFMAFTPLASQAVEAWLDQFDFETSPDALCDWLYGQPFNLDGGVPTYGSPELIIGAAPVRPLGPDLFEIDEHAGQWAVLQPVAPDGETIIDLVTWHGCRPDRWRLLTGNGEALGEREIALRQDRDGPLEVFATPMAWHRAAGRGVCLLRREWQVAQRLFIGERELIAETEQLAAWLDQALRFRPSPVILLQDRKQAA